MNRICEKNNKNNTASNDNNIHLKLPNISYFLLINVVCLLFYTTGFFVFTQLISPIINQFIYLVISTIINSLIDYIFHCRIFS